MKRIFLLVLLCASSAYATVINVPADQPTIQAGIDVAVDGDTVLVAPGVYFGALNISGKSIALIGAAAESTTIWLYGPDIGAAITVQGPTPDTAVIKEFTIRGSGVLITNGASATVEQCCITGCAIPGVDVKDSSYAAVLANRIHGNSSYAIHGSQSQLVIRGNLMFDNDKSLYKTRAVSLTSSISELRHNTIIASYGSDGTSPTVGAVNLSSCDSIFVYDNVIAFDPDLTGLYVVSPAYYEVEYNDIYDFFYNCMPLYLCYAVTNVSVDPLISAPDYLPEAGSPLIGSGSVGSNIGIETPVVGCAPVPPSPVCGNGILEPYEQCDDGNSSCNDGCTPVCRLERTECTITRPGDINDDCFMTSADVIYLVNYIFKGGPAPIPCPAAADGNGSGEVNSADVIQYVKMVFKGVYDAYADLTPCDC